MSAPGAISRGHPLFALLAVLGGWAVGRATTWEPIALPQMSDVAPPAMAFEPAPFAGYGPQSMADLSAVQAYGPAGAMGDFPAHPQTGAYFPRRVLAGGVPVTGWFPPGLSPTIPARPAHLQSDFSGIEALPRFYAPESPGVAGPALATLPPPRPRRWSLDAWALMRRNEAGLAASPGVLPATYGASQAGAVLRYRLALASRLQPSVYLRTTATTGMIRESAAALGVSARPLASVPVLAALEGRLTDQGGIRRFQPAVMAITQFAPLDLPAGLRAEAYAQGGYVGGRFATPFADGQVRVDRSLTRVGKVEARLGGGVWAGAQKGAARLDAGPSASMTMPLGHGLNGRVAVDWRFRLAGDAVPDSGPALTLSAGF